MLKQTKQLISLIAISLFIGISQCSCQGLKGKLKSKIPSKDRSSWYECGYVHQETLKEKANPMKALQKGVGQSVTKSGKSTLNTSAISVFYQAHLHPESIVRFPTKTDGWETCGDAVYAGFSNWNGTGLSSTDGEFKINGQAVPSAGMGTYFYGFKPEQRGEKKIEIGSSSGQILSLSIGPGAPLRIVSVNGVTKGEEISIDGNSDLVIELDGANTDADSKLHVQLVCKLVGTPIVYDLLVCQAKNTITIPKESFKHFEGSPAPFVKQNTLIINRVTEEVIEGTAAGALRKVEAYMDWVPVTLSGDLSKGNMISAGFDTTKNKIIKVDLTQEGQYHFTATNEALYKAAPIRAVKSVGVASFVVRGNLSSSQVSREGDWMVKSTKWFPGLDRSTWQSLADKMYNELELGLKEIGLQIIPINDLRSAKAYTHIKPIRRDVSENFVEMGAHGTQRIITTSASDVWKDLSISFPSDFVAERLHQEVDMDAVLAVTIDLNFNFETEGLDVKFTAVAFAPNISHKTGSTYFTIKGSAKGKSLAEIRKIPGGATEQLYQMIHGDSFAKELINAIQKLKEEENNHPELQKLWDARN